MKRAYALLGGPHSVWPADLKEQLKKALQKQDLIFASDRGCLYLQELGIKADLAVGDFDSLKSNELKIVEKNSADIRYSHPVKDLTDSEQLFRVAFEDYQVDQLKVFGATGGRLDHFLVNLFTFVHEPLKRFCQQVEFIDQQNIIDFYLPGRHVLKTNRGYSYVGLGNLTGIKNFQITGARYELKDYSSEVPTLFSSNEFIKDQPIQIAFEEGIAIAIFTKDKNRFANLN